MTKTIFINGTERAIENKDRYGMYHAFLNNKDIKWLNNLKDKYETIEMDLLRCFSKRGIRVKSLVVSNSAKTYRINVIRAKA